MAVTGATWSAEPFAGGRPFGDTGAYELVRGEVRFALDPLDPRNAVVTDIALAPRNAEGCVEASAQFVVVRPVEPGRGNGRLLYDVPNRGNLLVLRRFDVEPAPPADGMLAVGDGWLLQRGYTVAWCAWQHDVPDEGGRLQYRAPRIEEGGAAVRGRVAVHYSPATPMTEALLSDGGRVPYPAADPHEPEATLTVRDHAGGVAQPVPRAAWSFARREGDRTIEDPTRVLYPDGFQPGRFYELTYTATAAVVAGFGLATTRDFISWLRYDTGADNPCAGHVRDVLAYGASQSGGFLRTLLQLGLHEDESGRPVVDGVLADIAGAYSVELNWRFAQPSYYGPYSLAYVFPFAELDQSDPATGRVDGRARRILASGHRPRVIFTNTSAEYWYLNGGLTHIDLRDGSDAPLPDYLRIFHFAGTQHGGSVFPLSQQTIASPDGPAAGYPLNAVDYRPLLRATLASLDRWVTAGEEPPPSRYPQAAEGTIATLDGVSAAFERLGCAALPPQRFALGPLDYGEGMALGRMTRMPPAMGAPYPFRVPAVDADGNDASGVRLPDLTVPLATHTGWNRRHPHIGGADQLGPVLSGATIPFARTPGERAGTDTRPAISERYASKAEYLEGVRAAAEALVAERRLLPEDVATVLRSSEARWDAWVGTE